MGTLGGLGIGFIVILGICLTIGFIAAVGVLISRMSSKITGQVDNVTKEAEAAVDAAMNSQPRVCSYCGVDAGEEDKKCVSCGAVLPPIQTFNSTEGESKAGTEMSDEAGSGANMKMSFTEIVRTGRTTVIKKVVKY